MTSVVDGTVSRRGSFRTERKTVVNSTFGSNNSTNSASSLTTGTFGSKISNLFGLNEELIFSFLVALRNPSHSSTINWLIFAFYQISSITALYSWVAHSEQNLTLEGTYTSVIAKIVNILQSYGLNLAGRDLNTIFLVGVFILQVVTFFCIIFGYNALIRGMNNIFFVYLCFDSLNLNIFCSDFDKFSQKVMKCGKTSKFS